MKKILVPIDKRAAKIFNLDPKIKIPLVRITIRDLKKIAKIINKNGS